VQKNILFSNNKFQYLATIFLNVTKNINFQYCRKTTTLYFLLLHCLGTEVPLHLTSLLQNVANWKTFYTQLSSTTP